MPMKRRWYVFLSVGAATTADESVAFRVIDVCFMVGAMHVWTAWSVRTFSLPMSAYSRSRVWHWTASRVEMWRWLLLATGPIQTRSCSVATLIRSLRRISPAWLVDQNWAQAQVTVALLFSCWEAAYIWVLMHSVDLYAADWFHYRRGGCKWGFGILPFLHSLASFHTTFLTSSTNQILLLCTITS